VADWGTGAAFKQIAVWTIRPELCRNPEHVDLLLEDIDRASRLGSTLVTQILDVWSEQGAVCVALEHYGRSLTDLTEGQLTSLSLPVGLALLLEVARALQVAHGHPGGPVVHGDLRPEWVLLGRDGTVKLGGFGFARFLPLANPGGEWCTSGGRCCQPPERLHPGPPDLRSDVFSVGALLLEMATGASPYMTREPDRLRELMSASTVPLQTCGAPQDVAAVIAQACGARPEDRYPGVADMAAQLHRLLLSRQILDSRALLCEALGATAALDLRPVEGRGDAISSPTDLSSAFLHERKPLFLGRSEVLAAVDQAVATSSQGAGQALMFVGEQGIGRSRLLAELGDRVRRSHPVTWIQIDSQPAEANVNFAAAMRLLSLITGQDPRVDRQQFGQRLKAFGLDSRIIAAIIGMALGAEEPPDPDRTAALIGQAIMTCLMGLSWEQTTVVAWDDLQWADPASLRCLEHLLRNIGRMPLVLLLTAPVSQEPGWVAPPPLTIPLRPLSRGECQEMTCAMTPGATRIEQELLDLLMLHTTGNPLLLEELVGLLRRGHAVEGVSGTLRLSSAISTLPSFEQVLGAKLQHLPPPTFKVAVAAALAGPALSAPVIAAATRMPRSSVEENLGALAGPHCILRRCAAGLRFPHEAMRRAAIDSLTERAQKHVSGRVAHAILDHHGRAELACGIADHTAALLCHAGEAVEAADLLVETASLQERRGDLHGAADRYARALELYRDQEHGSPQTILELHIRTGQAALRGMHLELGQQILRQAIAMADRMDSRRLGAEGRVLLCRLLTRQGRLNEAMDRAREAVSFAETCGDQMVLARAYAAIADSYQQRGEYGPDFEYLSAALLIATKAGATTQIGEYLQLALAHAGGVGRYKDVKTYLLHARTIARSTGDPTLTCQLYRLEGALHLMRGDYEQALGINQEGIVRARRHGLAEPEIVMLHNAGDCHLHLGQMQEALFYFGESLHRSRAACFDRLTEANEMYLGFLEATHLGRPGGLDRLRRAIAAESKVGRIWNVNQGHLLLGQALLGQGEKIAALEQLKAALRIAEKTGVAYFINEARRWLDVVLEG